MTTIFNKALYGHFVRLMEAHKNSNVDGLFIREKDAQVFEVEFRITRNGQKKVELYKLSPNGFNSLSEQSGYTEKVAKPVEAVKEAPTKPLKEMNKKELIQQAVYKGVDWNDKMTNEELIALVEGAS